jgi:hypothetical protein
MTLNVLILAHQKNANKTSLGACPTLRGDTISSLYLFLQVCGHILVEVNTIKVMVSSLDFYQHISHMLVEINTGNLCTPPSYKSICQG